MYKKYFEGVSQLATPRGTQSDKGAAGSARRQFVAVRRSSGFTIIELMIATSIFGVILLVALAGFTGIGNLFYKGVAVTQTQSIASQIMDDLRSNIQSASAVTIPDGPSPDGYSYYCLGGVRYTYQLNHIYDASQPESYSTPSGNFGLLKDTLPGSGACAPPCASGCAAPFNKPQEVLADKMQLIKFEISASGSQLYNVYVNVAYGDQSDFANYGDADNMTCQGGLNDQRFCAVIRLSSSVYEGLHT